MTFHVCTVCHVVVEEDQVVLDATRVIMTVDTTEAATIAMMTENATDRTGDRMICFQNLCGSSLGKHFHLSPI